MVEEAALPHRDPGALRDALRARAEAIHADEVDRCVRIGEHGAGLLRAGAQVLTHCNAGALATGGFGTALGIIRAAHRRDPGMHVWVDETRPLLQGARLTAWELQQEDIAATLITDSTAAWLMAERKVDAVITGADRIARNGDTANKIGTYGLAVLARAHGLPFYVAAPTSTIDTAHRERPRDPHRAPPRRGGGGGRGRGRRRLQPGLRRDAGRVRERDRHRARRAPAAVPVHLSAPDVRELFLRLARHGQEHLLRFWDELDDAQRARLAEDIGQIDLDLVDRPRGRRCSNG